MTYNGLIVSKNRQLYTVYTPNGIAIAQTCIILKESLEEKRAETARAVRVFGSDGEAPSEV